MTRQLLLLLLLFPVLWACEQSVGRSNVKPAGRTTTEESVLANINLGVEYMQRNEYKKALDRLTRARDIDPGYFGAYSMLGLLYQRLGNSDEADWNFKRAIRLNPADSSIYNNYGQFLCQAGRVEEAEKTFLQAATDPLYPTPEIAIANAGICAQRNNDSAKAETYFRRALELDARLTEPLYRMSQISYDSEKHLSARGYLQRYIAIAKHNAKTLWLGILIERKLGDLDTVASYGLLLRNNFPDSAEAKMLKESGGS